MENKTCSKCGVPRPLTGFYVSKGRASTVCKQCEAISAKKRYLNAKPPQGEDKKCYRCGETKPLVEFNLIPQAACKACINIYQVAYRNRNRERRNVEAGVRYLAKKDEIRVYAAQHRAQHRERINAHQRDYAKRKESLALARAIRAKYSKTLTDAYVRRSLVKNTGINFASVPPELIAVKRMQLQILRKVRNS